MHRPIFAAAFLSLAAVNFAAELIDRSPERPMDPKIDKSARIVEWCHPVYPPELKAARVRGEVRVRFIIDPTGAITSLEALPGDERFAPAALAAVAKWKFSPGIEKGVPVPVSREVLITFQPNRRLEDPKTSRLPYELGTPQSIPPGEFRAPDPIYPEYLGKRELFGEVEMNLGIDSDGHVTGVEILRSTYPGFITAGLAAVDKWVFTPARAGRLPEAGEKKAVLSFVVKENETGTDRKRDWTELNGIVLHVPGEPKAADYFTEPVTALIFVDPVYPAELRQKGITGKARASFSVDEEGRVVNVVVMEATEPEFGEALAAAASSWVFQPLYRNGEKTDADFLVHWEFAAPVEGSADARLLALEAQGIKPIASNLLDKVPGVLFHRAARYPAAMFASHTPGKANIEVVIDQNGQVCLPRVVSATAPEFGWAAATAVSQWYFETPHSGGKPVDVRVVIPFVFNPK